MATSEQAWVDAEAELIYVVQVKPADAPLTEFVSAHHVAVVRVLERMTPHGNSGEFH